MQKSLTYFLILKKAIYHYRLTIMKEISSSVNVFILLDNKILLIEIFSFLKFHYYKKFNLENKLS